MLLPEKDIASQSTLINDLIEDLDAVRKVITIPIISSQLLELVFKWAARKKGAICTVERWREQDMSSKVEIIWVSLVFPRLPYPPESWSTDGLGIRRPIT